MCCTDDAAAATAPALSLHLNQGSAFFGALQLRDIAPGRIGICGPADWSRPYQPARLGHAETAESRRLAGVRSRRAHPHPCLPPGPLLGAHLGSPPGQRRR